MKQLMLNPRTHSRPTLNNGGESLYTFTVKGLSFDVMFDSVITKPLFNDISLYRNSDLEDENTINFNPLSTHESKLKPFRGSSSPFLSTHALLMPWVDRGLIMHFTDDKITTHVGCNAWVDGELKKRLTTHLIPTLKGGISGLGRVPGQTMNRNPFTIMEDLSNGF